MLLVKLKKNYLSNNYTIILAKKQKKKNISDKVIEKLGTYNTVNKRVHINYFRLIYWFSKNVYCTGNVWCVLASFGLFND